jgi:hypothetical protein
MTEGWEAAMCEAEVCRWMCRSLRRAREERRARSGGETMLLRGLVGLLVSLVGEVAERRSGEGWPERERRISWSMVTARAKEVVCMLEFWMTIE